MANKKPNWTAWVLKFVGALAYLDVVWTLWQAPQTSVFGPVLVGLAVVMSVGFFIGTLVNLMGSNDDKMKMWNARQAMIAGFALLSLMATGSVTGTLSWVALVGFVLSYVGNGMDMK
jgi:hypothetical protein